MRIRAPISTKPLGRRLRHLLARWWRSVIVVQDTPNRVAWGFAIGMFIGWLPIMGVQMAVAGVVTWLLRGNVVASLAPVWISNPLTVVPMYSLINQLGSVFVGRRLGISEIKQALGTALELGVWDGSRYLIVELWGAFQAMLVGGCLIGLLSAVPSYFIVKAAVAGYQKRRMERRLRWLGIVEPPRPADVHPTTPDEVAAAPPPAEEEPR